MPTVWALILIGAIVGLLAYLTSAKRRGVPVNVSLIFEAIAFGGLFGAAVHLLLCIVWPEHLVHYRGPHGELIPHPGVAELDSAHFAELLAGAGAATFLAFKHLHSVCTKPGPYQE